MPPDLVTFRVTCPVDAPHLGWADRQTFCLPRAVWQGAGLEQHLDAASNLRIPPRFIAKDAQVAEAVRLHAAFTERRPLSSRLPVSYVAIPGWIRNLIAAAIGRWKRRSSARWSAFPRWPLDLSADFLADLVTRRPGPFAAGPTPVLLTHDLDSPEGVANLVHQFLDLEEAAGARSTSYVVPCGWPIERRLLDELKQRGHGLGVHGYDHSNLTAFARDGERRRRLHAAHFLIEEYGANGYRAPSLLRTRALLHDLAGLYAYDSSIPTSGGLFPVPNNGCASARPFPIEGITEIPLSLPRDGSLRFLGYRPWEIAKLWIACAEKIARSGGVVVLLTHCEARFSGNAGMLNAYRSFLEHVASSKRFVWSSPVEILARVRSHAAAA